MASSGAGQRANGAGSGGFDDGGSGGSGGGPGGSGGPAAPPQPDAKQARRPSRMSLRNWRVRSRLLLLITIPTLTAVALGGIRIANSVQSALAYQRVLQLANLSSDITVLAQRLEDERDQTVYFISLPVGGRANVMFAASPADKQAGAQQLAVIQQQQRLTGKAVTAVESELRQVGTAFPSQVRQEAVTALSELGSPLSGLRSAAATTSLPALVVVQKYANLIDDLLVLEDATVQGASDPQLAQSVHVLGLVSQMQQDASEQRAILAAALLNQNLNPAELQALTTAQSDQTANLNQFKLSATPAQQDLFNRSGSGSIAFQAPADEIAAISLQATNHNLQGDTTSADDWYGSMSHTITYQMGSVLQSLVSGITTRATSLRNQAVTAAIAIGLAVMIILALALLFTVVVVRSMVRPLRRLRAGALEVAGVRLPETVRQMSEGEGGDAPLEVEPIEVTSVDEIGEVARAFDQVHREAVRLASNEAALRGNINAMFVNLSRRSQSLVERQIRLIDDLEQGEQDSERLGNLFQMDHLATRMRRNSENLLVLAGHELSRRWTEPVPLVDVLRAAVSEIEQYERITLNVQPGIAVRGPAVNDVVHLLAELAENATSFSAAETPVNISGHLLNSGGVLLDITDQGVGMHAEEMAHANWRLDNPPVVDVAVSRRMGLFVVARLAARHGIRVRLRPATMGGLTALVWLPDEVITHETTVSPPGFRRFEVPAPGPAATDRTGAWPSAGAGDDRAATAAALTAARAPRFTPLRPDADTNSFPAVGADDAAAADAGGTMDQPAASTLGAGGDTAPPSTSDSGALPVFGAPLGGDARGLAGHDELSLPSSFGADSNEDQQGVVVPPVVSAGEENRLPIFESVESDWFRRGRHGADRVAARTTDSSSTTASSSSTSTWTSPSDEGWRAAEVAHAPVADGVTGAGLPKRVPKANLVPGGVGANAATTAASVPARSAAQTRERLSSFQRGIREARVAAHDDDTPGGEENGAP
jgi:signal transduction histidine kinase